ncbi:MAG: ssDNA-binding protein, partial [Plesiomonas shigelloides]
DTRLCCQTNRQSKTYKGNEQMNDKLIFPPMRSPVGRILWPALAKPEEYRGRERFKVTVLVPKSEEKAKEWVTLNEAIEALVAAERWSFANRQIKHPIQDGDFKINDKTGLPNELYSGHFYFTASTAQRVPVFGPNKLPYMLEKIEDEVYSGCYGVAVVYPFLYGKDPTKTNGGRGVSLALMGVQKVRDGDLVGKRAIAPDFDNLLVNANADESWLS